MLKKCDSFLKTPVFALAILFLSPALVSCAPQAVQQIEVSREVPIPTDPYFYEGLLKRRGGEEAEALALFKKALSSQNPRISAAAAAELLAWSLADGIEFDADTRRLIGTAAAGSWAAAFEMLGAVETAGGRPNALALLLCRSASAEVLHAVSDWRRRRIAEGTLPAGLVFSAAEEAALNGRVAASRSRWNDALSFFRIALNGSPDLFFRHPYLLSDLGRAFQFTATGREGIDLFLELEAVAARVAAGERAYWRGHAFPPHGPIHAGNESHIRFQLLFFAGRIARQRGLENISHFERALPFARDVSAAQSDATIWYILRSAIDHSPDLAIRHLENYVSYWHNDIGFFDVMDRLSRQLILDWRWDRMLHVLGVVRDRQSAITAKFAWIIARAIQEGYIPRQQAAAALGLPAGDPVTPLVRMSFDSSGRSLYYRLMSANFLGEEFFPPVEDILPPLEKSCAARFILGFFEHGAAEFAMRYVRALENELPLEELRLVSEAVAGTGNYLDSILMITRFARRESFHFSQMTRRDWELWYPRPFWDLIERYSMQANIEPHLMLALIRAESAFMPAIVSHAGAIGMTQLMPATATETAERIRRLGGPDFRVETGGVGSTNLNLNDPAVNIHIGATYLDILNGRLGDPMLALLAYNAGTGRVRSWLNGNRQALGFDLPIDLFLETVPFPETRNYGRNVTAAAEIYRQLYFR